MKKRVLAVILGAVMTMSLAACGSSDAGKTSSNDSEKSYTIGISQFAEHGSLDNCREGFLEGLKEEGIEKEDLGREKFLERAWDWKEEYGGTIIEQMKKLGSSCDWDRERFTMDEGCSEAVKEVFIKLYEKGYMFIFRSFITFIICRDNICTRNRLSRLPINSKL